MRRGIIESGTRFTRLVVVKQVKSYIKGRITHRRYLCKCDCGREVSVVAPNLRSQTSRSCGCLKAEITSTRLTTHGKSKMDEYTIWKSMISRCNDVNDSYYGGRGIKVCERWVGENGFVNFISDMGTRPTPQHTIERKDNNGNYEPDNCRWATRKEQARNTRNNRLITHNNKTMCISEWSEELNIPVETIKGRLRIGWTPERALTTKVRRRIS